jgi:hypothetical protein
MDTTDDDWLTSAGASALLRRSERQIRSYASAGKVRNRRGPGGRAEYHAGDVRALAAALQVERDPPQRTTVEIVPSTQLAAQVERLYAELLTAQARAERAETALRLLPPPAEAQAATAAARAETQTARAEAQAAQVEAATARAKVEGLQAALAQQQGTSAVAWRVALLALLLALLAVVALVIVALVRSA